MRVFRDTGYWAILVYNVGLFGILVMGCGIFSNFGIWDIENYFGYLNYISFWI